MSISPIFMFAPIPLTAELSPLAHAAALAQMRAQASGIVPVERRRAGLAADEKPMLTHLTAVTAMGLVL